MTPPVVDISICPTTLEFNNGDTYDSDALLDAMRAFILKRNPDAKISLQIGHRQGDQWARIDGCSESGRELVEDFFSRHGTDEELFVQSETEGD